MVETREIEVTLKDLPLHCPTAEVALWCTHPRIFLDITKTGRAFCPYCSTRYRLKPGTVVPAHSSE